MLNSEAKRQLELSPPSRKLSFVVIAHVNIESNDIRNMKNFKQRSEALRTFYKAAKGPFLDAVQGFDGLRIVDCLEGTPSMIIAGAARSWQQILDERSSISTDPRFEILPNTTFYATT